MIETPGRLEPCRLDDPPRALRDLAAGLLAAASELRDRITDPRSDHAARLAGAQATNAIEGHWADIAEIEAALRGERLPPERAIAALEGRAVVLVGRELDGILDDGRVPHAFTPEALCWIHRRLCEEMPAVSLQLAGPEGRVVLMEPGRLRGAGDPEVVVGRHQPPSGARVKAFLQHLAWRLGPAFRLPEAAVLALPAAHHRLAFVHPFPDLNGRVARLATEGMARRVGLQGPWSLSCALREGLSGSDDYLPMLEMADRPRQGDRDGRGNLSLQALKGFTGWMLKALAAEIRRAGPASDLGNSPTP